jgi:hypothetical protein
MCTTVLNTTERAKTSKKGLAKDTCILLSFIAAFLSLVDFFLPVVHLHLQLHRVLIVETKGKKKKKKEQLKNAKKIK